MQTRIYNMNGNPDINPNSKTIAGIKEHKHFLVEHVRVKNEPNLNMEDNHVTSFLTDTSNGIENKTETSIKQEVAEPEDNYVAVYVIQKEYDRKPENERSHEKEQIIYKKISNRTKYSQLKDGGSSDKHKRKKLFNCIMCAYQTCNQSDLICHRGTHSKEKPFSCVFCDYKCSRKSLLTLHTKMHERGKLFQCTICSYKCATISNLIRHNITHTGSKRFSCNFCNCKFTQSGSLKRHLRSCHTGENQRACRTCEYKALQESLQKHLTVIDRNKILTTEKDSENKLTRTSTCNLKRLQPDFQSDGNKIDVKEHALVIQSEVLYIKEEHDIKEEVL